MVVRTEEDGIAVHFPITGSVAGLAGRASMGGYLHIPPVARPEKSTLFVLLPGGTYTTFYWRAAPEKGYSCARFLANAGYVVLTLDNLGTGESRCEFGGLQLTPERMATALAAAVEMAKDELALGSLVPGWRTSVGFTVLVGHSMGGYLAILAQALFRICDALIVQSAPNRPGPIPFTEETREHLFTANSAGYVVLPRTELHTFFHGDFPPPPDLLAEDDRRAVPIPLPLMKAVMGIEGPVMSEYAGQVTVPVLATFGQQDIASDPLQELNCYARSPLREVFVQPEAAHCTNYGRLRELTWSEFDEFAQRARNYMRRMAAELDGAGVKP